MNFKVFLATKWLLNNFQFRTLESKELHYLDFVTCKMVSNFATRLDLPRLDLHGMLKSKVVLEIEEYFGFHYLNICITLSFYGFFLRFFN